MLFRFAEDCQFASKVRWGDLFEMRQGIVGFHANYKTALHKGIRLESRPIRWKRHQCRVNFSSFKHVEKVYRVATLGSDLARWEKRCVDGANHLIERVVYEGRKPKAHR